MNHDELAHLDAAYVLGALGPEERRAFEEHLGTCRSCADSVRRLEELPGLLAHVDESVFQEGEAAPPVPETLLPGLLRQSRVRRRRGRRRVLAAAAAALVVVGGGAVAWVQTGDRSDEVAAPGQGVSASTGPSSAPSSSPSPGTPMQQVDQRVVSATLALEEVAWGTRLDLVCSYEVQGGGYDEGSVPSYTMAVQTRDGTWEQVAGWRAVPGRTITVTGATAATRGDIVSVEVRTPSGRTLLELDT